MAYTEADKARAIALYFEEGASAAALAVGATRQSVYVWLQESDTDTKKGSASRIATAERLATKRAAMVELFHDKALELAAAVDPSDPATARFMLAACQAADKALLLAGLVRKATDPSRMTLAEVEAQIAELEAEHGRLAPDPVRGRDSDIDRELVRVQWELERKMRAELLAEVDQAMAVEVKGGQVPSWLARRAEVISEVARRPMNYGNGGSPPDAA